MYDQPATPRIEVLFGPTDLGLNEAMYLLSAGQQTFEQLFEVLHEPEDPTSQDERLDCEDTLGEALDALEREGFIERYEVGDERNFSQWQYELTPAGLAQMQKVEMTQEGPMTWWRAKGTDGQMWSHGQQILDDE